MRILASLMSNCAIVPQFTLLVELGEGHIQKLSGFRFLNILLG